LIPFLKALKQSRSHTGETRNAYRNLVGNPPGKTPLGEEK